MSKNKMYVYAIAVRPKGIMFPIVAWLIMIFQGMNPFKKESYSHLAIRYVGKDDRFYIIDSTNSGKVSVKLESEFLKKYKIVNLALLPGVKYESFKEWENSILLREYDKLQIVGLFLKCIGIISKNKWGHNYKKMTCNEVVLNYLEKNLNLNFGDPDNYDLNMTWDIVKTYKIF